MTIQQSRRKKANRKKAVKKPAKKAAKKPASTRKKIPRKLQEKSQEKPQDKPLSFKDEQDRIWTTSVTHGTILKIRDKLNIDIYKEFDLRAKQERTVSVFEDISQEKQISLIYVVIEEQLHAQNMNEEDFAYMLGNSTLEEAIDATWRGLCGFFTSRGHGSILLALWEKAKNLNREMEEEVIKEIGDLDLNSRMKSQVARTMKR